MDISVLKSLALSKSNVFLVRNQKKSQKDAKFHFPLSMRIRDLLLIVLSEENEMDNIESN
jgi:hypothetical protein